MRMMSIKELKPGPVATAMFSFGKSAGFIEGVLHAFRIPYQLVPPQTWKKEFSLSKQGKEKSVEVCKRLFPGAHRGKDAQRM